MPLSMSAAIERIVPVDHDGHRSLAIACRINRIRAGEPARARQPTMTQGHSTKRYSQCGCTRLSFADADGPHEGRLPSLAKDWAADITRGLRRNSAGRPVWWHRAGVHRAAAQCTARLSLARVLWPWRIRLVHDFRSDQHPAMLFALLATVAYGRNNFIAATRYASARSHARVGVACDVILVTADSPWCKF